MKESSARIPTPQRWIWVVLALLVICSAIARAGCARDQALSEPVSHKGNCKVEGCPACSTCTVSGACFPCQSFGKVCDPATGKCTGAFAKPRTN